MQIYHFSAKTGELMSPSQARRDPLGGGFLIPRNATSEAPPATGANEVAVFERGAWVKKTDLRGTKYWTIKNNEVVETEIEDIGATVPVDALTEKPADKPSAYHKWENGAWVLDRAAKRAAATITRAQFLKGCVTAGIITADVAEAAATGEWPPAFNTFLSGLTRDQRIEAKATWADAKEVRRTAPILALIADDQQVSEAQLDALFGIS